MNITYNNGEKASEDIFESPSKRILLIEPPFYNLFGYKRWHYPITLTLVGSFLKEKGHDVKIYDGDKPFPNCSSYSRTQIRDNYYKYELALKNNNHRIWGEIKEEIYKFNPEIIGITSISAKIDSADKIAKIGRDTLGEKVKIILGGPHAEGMRSSYPNYCFEKDYDFIVTHIPGLVNRKPDKSLLSGNGFYSKKDLSTILTSTGCPNSCTYCCNSLPNKRFHFRDMHSIEDELKEIKENAKDEKRYITIADDSYFAYTKRFHEINSLFKEIGLNFIGNSRIKELSPEKIEEFIKSGGKKICIGIESGSQQILDKIKKRTSIEQIINGAKLANDFAVPWHAFFIVGFPFENMDDLKLTREMIYKTQPTFVSINRFTPYPGTELWNDYFFNSKMEFKDLFQLNDRSAVRLSNEMENYINLMIKELDEYNLKKNEKDRKNNAGIPE